MKFYTNSRWCVKVLYGDKADKLEQKLSEYNFRFKMGDYTTIDSEDELRDLDEFKEGDMYVYNNDEIWVSTGSDYTWYRYKFIPEENRIMQRIKIFRNDDIDHNIEDELRFTKKPTHKKRKENKENSGHYLTEGERNTIKMIVIFIIATQVIQFIMNLI